MIAYCGLLCDSCPIHLATIEKDKLLQQKMRAYIAKNVLRNMEWICSLEILLTAMVAEQTQEDYFRDAYPVK